jgi:hypothetical protein
VGKLEIKVLAVRLIDSGRSVVAFADVWVDGWIIKDWRVLRFGNEIHTKPPQIAVKDPASKDISLRTIVSVPNDQFDLIEAEVLKSYEAKLKAEKK